MRVHGVDIRGIPSSNQRVQKSLGRFTGIDVVVTPSQSNTITTQPDTLGEATSKPNTQPTHYDPTHHYPTHHYMVRPWLPVTGVKKAQSVTLELQPFKAKAANYMQDAFMLAPVRSDAQEQHAPLQPLEVKMVETPRGWILPKTLAPEVQKELVFNPYKNKTLGYRFKVQDDQQQTHTLLDGGAFAVHHSFRGNKLSSLPMEKQQFSLVTTQDASRLAQPSAWFQRNTLVDVLQGNILGRRVAYALTKLRREATPETQPVVHAMEQTLLPSQRGTPLMYDFNTPEVLPSRPVTGLPEDALPEMPLMKISRLLSARRIQTLWQTHLINKVALPYHAGDILVRPFIGNDTVSNHGYYASDLYQMSPQMGNHELFKHVGRLMLSHNLSLVSDFAFVGKGLQSTEAMANLHWREMSPFWDWFRYDKPSGGSHAPFQLPAHGHSKPITLGLLPSWTDPHTKALYPDAHRIAFKVINAPYLKAHEKNHHYNPHAMTFLEMYDPTKETSDGQMRLHHTPDEDPVQRRRIPVAPEVVQQVLKDYEADYPHAIQLPSGNPTGHKEPVLSLPDNIRNLSPQAPEVQTWLSKVTTWGHLQLGLPGQDDSGFKWDGQIPNLLPNLSHPDVKQHVQSAFDFHARTLVNDQTQWLADALVAHQLGKTTWHSPDDVLNAMKPLSRAERLPDPMQDGSWQHHQPLPPLPASQDAQKALATHVFNHYQALAQGVSHGAKSPTDMASELSQRLFNEYPIEALPLKDEDGSPLMFKASLMNPVLKRNCQSLFALGASTDFLEHLPIIGRRVSFDGALKQFFTQALHSSGLSPAQKAVLADPIGQSLMMSQFGEALYLKLLTGLDRQQLYYEPNGGFRDPAQVDTMMRHGLEQTLTQAKKAWMLTASPVQNAEMLPGFLIQRLNTPEIQKDLQRLLKQATPEVSPEILLQAKALVQSQRPVLKARLDAAKDFGAMSDIMETQDIPIDGTSSRKSHKVWEEMGQKMSDTWQTLLGHPQAATQANPQGFYGFFPQSEVIAEFTNEGWLSAPLTGVMHKMGNVWTGFVNYALRNRLTRLVGEQNEAHKEPFSQLGQGLTALQSQLHAMTQYYPTSATLQGNQNFTSHHDWTLTMDELIKPGGIMTMNEQKYRTARHALGDTARLLGGQSHSGQALTPKLLERVWMNRLLTSQPDTMKARITEALHVLAQGDTATLESYAKDKKLMSLLLNKQRFDAHLLSPEDKLNALKELFNLETGLLAIPNLPPEVIKTFTWMESECLKDHLTHPSIKQPTPFPEKLLDPETMAQTLSVYDPTFTHVIHEVLTPEQRQQYLARIAVLGQLAYQMTRPSTTTAATAIWNNALDDVLSQESLSTRLAERLGVDTATLQHALPEILGRAMVRAAEKEGDRFGMLPIEVQLASLTQEIPALKKSLALSDQEKTLLTAMTKHPEGVQALSRMLHDSAYVPALDKLSRIQALQMAYPGKPSLNLADMLAKTGTETYANRWVQNRPTFVIPELEAQYLAQFTHVAHSSPLLHTRTSPVALKAYGQYQDELKALTLLRDDPRFEAFNRGGFPPTRTDKNGHQHPLITHEDHHQVLPIYRPTSPESNTPSVMMLINRGEPSNPYPSWDNRIGEDPSGRFPQAVLQQPVIQAGTSLPLTGWSLKEGTTFEVYRPVVDDKRPSTDPHRVSWQTKETITVQDGQLTLPEFSKFIVLREKRENT
jgi:hypothetical protein